MSIGSLLKRLGRALPVVVAAAPGVLDAVKQVRRALEEREAGSRGGSPADGGRLSADSERAAR